MSQAVMKKYKEKKGSKKDAGKQRIKPIPFGERPGPEPYNASEVVALADSRFLFCDNNIGDALFELRLAPDASMERPLIRCAVGGMEAGTVDDLEGMALVEQGAHKFIFAIPSLSLKQRKKPHKKRVERGKVAATRNSILRISTGEDDQLKAEVIPDFRAWLIEHAPELGKSPRYLPDDGGLNVEGLGWDPANQALLLGLRTPVMDGKPLILRVRIKEIDGPWSVDNLEMLQAVSLQVKENGHGQGIRSIEYDPSRKVSLVVVGNSTSSSKAPFRLYSWDGNLEGAVRCFDKIRFDKKMRVEGITQGTIGGREAIIFVDDTGGYQVVWNDDPRLQ
jgi:hypothetical protein